MIRLQFVSEAGFAAGLIRYCTAGPVSHVDAVLPDGRLLGARSDRIRLDNGASIEPGVQIRPADYARFTCRYVFELPAPASLADRFYGWLRDQLGAPYDWSAILGFAAGRDWRDPERWFCSELQGAALEAVDIVPRLFTPDDRLSPTALAEALSARPDADWRQLTTKGISR